MRRKFLGLESLCLGTFVKLICCEGIRGGKLKMTAILRTVSNSFSNILKPSIGKSSLSVNGSILSPLVVPQRTKYNEYIDWRMVRDVRRRKTVKEYAKLRLQINAIRYNTILPQQLRDVAQKEIEALPSDSCFTKTHPRCVLTSRARGRLKAFRMSRIVWRHLADYNQLSGAERAMWGWS